MPELNEFSDQEIINMERMVSKFIDSYCGQSFSYEIAKTKTSIGPGSDYLTLPSRLWQLDEVTILDDYITIVRDSEGNVIDRDYSQRSILPYVVLDYDNPWTIRNRRNIDYVSMSEISNRHLFKNGAIYAITGNWGYQYVPHKVTEAATILVKLYFFDDANYRDRYLTEIMAGNWRMKFRSTGDETTGSANADVLLSAYRNINAAVI